MLSMNLIQNNEMMKYLLADESFLLASVTDNRGVILDVSTAFCNISGYTREELIGQPHNIIRHPDSSSEMFEDLWETIKTGKQWKGEIKNRKKNGDYYWVITTVFPRFDKDDEMIGFVSLRHDITALRELQEREEILKEQTRNAAMGEMIGAIAHQWNQPLTLISSKLTKLKLKIELGTLEKEDIDEAYDEINKRIDFISETVNNFRNFFKTKQPSIRTSLIELIQYSIDLVSPFAQENFVQINFDYDHVQKDSGWLIHSISKNDFAHILLNLIKNSVEAHIENGTESPYINIRLKRQGNMFIMAITDNAGGISKEVLEKVFDKSFSSKGEKGTGIGLYMTKLIIEHHFHGSIRVNKEEDGTCFTIILPSMNEDTYSTDFDKPVE